MNEIKGVSYLLGRAFETGPWHGPSVLQVLEGVDAERALARPIANAHNIWEIVLHLAAWEGVVSRRLLGEKAGEPEEGDWPAVTDTSEAAWAETLDRLKRNNARLREVVGGLADGSLAGEESDEFESIHGALGHEAYHAGQIAILKKAE